MTVVRLRNREVVDLDEYRADHLAQMHANLDVIQSQQLLDDVEEAAYVGGERFMRFMSHRWVAGPLIFVGAVMIAFGLFHDGTGR